METPKEHIEALFSNTKEYIENKTDLWKLKAIDKSTDIIASLVEKLLLFVILTVFFVLLTIGLALLIGYWLGHSFWGFFVLAAFYGIVGWVIHATREKFIKTPISNGFIQKFLN
jgi:uncharacterized RDD family membrane protein YckC